MENKSKNYIKNILLGIALLPYIIIMIMCIYYAITGYSVEFYEKMYYGLSALGEFLSDVWWEIIDSLMDFPTNLIRIPITILWIGYQIYYFITFKRVRKENKKELKENNRNTSKNINFKKIIFYISIGCWCLYFASGIYAFLFGSKTGGGLFYPKMEYGMDALVSTLFWNLIAFSIIPVLPISLLYIVIYMIVNKRKKKKEAIGKANIDQTNIEN